MWEPLWPKSPPSHSNAALSFSGSISTLWSFPFCCSYSVFFLQSLHIIFILYLAKPWPQLNKKPVSLKELCLAFKALLPFFTTPRDTGALHVCRSVPWITAAESQWQNCSVSFLNLAGMLILMHRDLHMILSFRPFHSPSAKTHLISLEAGMAYSSWLQSLPLSYHNLCPK